MRQKTVQINQTSCESTPHYGQTPQSNKGRPTGEPFSGGTSDEVEVNSLPALQNALGISDDKVILNLMAQAAVAIQFEDLDKPVDWNYVATAVRRIGSKGELEGMLAVQMLWTHIFAMKCIRRAAQGQSNAVIDSNLNKALELLKVFAMQLQALKRS